MGTLLPGDLQEAEAVVMATLMTMTMMMRMIVRITGQEITLPGRNCCSDARFVMNQDIGEVIGYALSGKNIVCFVKQTRMITKIAI